MNCKIVMMAVSLAVFSLLGSTEGLPQGGSGSSPSNETLWDKIQAFNKVDYNKTELNTFGNATLLTSTKEEYNKVIEKIIELKPEEIKGDSYVTLIEGMQKQGRKDTTPITDEMVKKLREKSPKKTEETNEEQDGWFVKFLKWTGIAFIFFIVLAAIVFALFKFKVINC